MENPNLWWETIGFIPQIVFTLEPTTTGLRSILCNDMSHFHYYLESAMDIQTLETQILRNAKLYFNLNYLNLKCCA